jgi:hypothetical protein
MNKTKSDARHINGKGSSAQGRCVSIWGGRLGSASDSYQVSKTGNGSVGELPGNHCGGLRYELRDDQSKFRSEHVFYLHISLVHDTTRLPYDIKTVSFDRLRIRERERKLDPKKVRQIADSIRTEGQLQFLDSVPESQRPAIARAAFSWTQENHELLGDIDIKYGQARHLSFKPFKK